MGRFYAIIFTVNFGVAGCSSIANRQRTGKELNRFMNKKKSSKSGAVIDIGSHTLKMRVAQFKKGEIADIDRLEYPLHLGHEVFHEGKISFESLRELSKALQGYSELLEGYGVDQVRVVATTALREAQNRAYVVDLLKIQNDMTVQVLEDDQEKTLIYSEMIRFLHQKEDEKEGNALLTYIGTGSIGIAVYDGTNVVYSQSIPIGSLKLRDVLYTAGDEPENYHVVIEEYLDAVMERIDKSLHGIKISRLVFTGSDINLIARVLGVQPESGCYTLHTAQVRSLYETVSPLSPEKISFRYEISEEEGDILYSALAIYSRLLRFSGAEYILLPMVDLWDGIMRHMLVPKSVDAYRQHICGSAIACAEAVAAKYGCPKSHSDTVRRFALKIFDKTKAIHGLSNQHRIILELAAILHDCGHYVNTKLHTRSSFDLVKNFDIYGMTKLNMLLIAYVASYNEFNVPALKEMRFSDLDEQQKISVSKLVAIFRLANSLDKSQKQKLPDIKVRMEHNRFLVTGETNEDMHLEKWAFAQCAPFFKEVFGIDPELTIRLPMI